MNTPEQRLATDVLIQSLKDCGASAINLRRLAAAIDGLGADIAERAAPVCRFGPGGDFVTDWPRELKLNADVAVAFVRRLYVAATTGPLPPHKKLADMVMILRSVGLVTEEVAAEAYERLLDFYERHVRGMPVNCRCADDGPPESFDERHL